MLSHQNTITAPQLPNHFSEVFLKIAGKIIVQPPPSCVSRAIGVHCDLCSEEAFGATEDLRRSGWGISHSNAFCPEHQAMI